MFGLSSHTTSSWRPRGVVTMRIAEYAAGPSPLTRTDTAHGPPSAAVEGAVHREPHAAWSDGLGEKQARGAHGRLALGVGDEACRAAEGRVLAHGARRWLGEGRAVVDAPV